MHDPHKQYWKKFRKISIWRFKLMWENIAPLAGFKLSGEAGRAMFVVSKQKRTYEP